MVLKVDLVGGPRFNTSICNLNSFDYLKVHEETLFGLFESPRAHMRPHMMEGVKRHDIHINLIVFASKCIIN